MKERRNIFILLIILFLLSSSSVVSADDVWLKNGDHISGKVVKMQDNKLTLTTGMLK